MISIRKGKEDRDTYIELNYHNMFWLFMIANVVGVILEGVWTVIKFGRWESHVNTIWGPFCLIYGIGAVTFYICSTFFNKKPLLLQFVFFGMIADIVEYICAWLIEEGLHMKAWTYSKQFMNLQGRISLQMTLAWGIIGVVYSIYLVPQLNKFFGKIQGNIWRIFCKVLTIFMVVNISATMVCMVRWSNRHQGKAPRNQIERYIDKHYDDAWMKHRFCEWWFIGEGKEFWKTYKKRG